MLDGESRGSSKSSSNEEGVFEEILHSSPPIIVCAAKSWCIYSVAYPPLALTKAPTASVLLLAHRAGDPRPPTPGHCHRNSIQHRLPAAELPGIPEQLLNALTRVVCLLFLRSTKRRLDRLLSISTIGTFLCLAYPWSSS